MLGVLWSACTGFLVQLLGATAVYAFFAVAEKHPKRNVAERQCLHLLSQCEALAARLEELETKVKVPAQAPAPPLAPPLALPPTQPLAPPPAPDSALPDLESVPPEAKKGKKKKRH